MAKLALLFALAILGPFAPAATHAPQPPSAPQPTEVTIAQFEQILSASAHLRDSKLAARIAGLELTERVSSPRLTRWEKQFPGKRTRQTLLALADLSAYQPLPADELPNLPTPDLKTQRAIFTRVIDYVASTLPRLPNFSALRSTTRFEIAPPEDILQEEKVSRTLATDGEKPVYRALGRVAPGRDGGQWLFLAATSTRPVTYRDGFEVTDIAHSDAAHDRPSIGASHPQLSTSGEFGPILSVVVGDAVRGKVFWSHWAPGQPKPLAVFRYTVPKEVSHYAVDTSTLLKDSTFPAYHGEIAVDPETGTIFRIALIAEMHSANLSVTGIVVDYGPVEIAGSTYTCPVRSIAISRSPDTGDKGAASSAIPVRVHLNDVVFTNYHVFRTEIRILPDTPQKP